MLMKGFHFFALNKLLLVMNLSQNGCKFETCNFFPAATNIIINRHSKLTIEWALTKDYCNASNLYCIFIS